MFWSISFFLLLSTLPSLSQARDFAAQIAAPPLGPAEASFNASVQALLSSTSVTSKILLSLLAPLEVEVARNSYVVRDGTSLKLNGIQWTASGANVYWLGLDENVIPPAGQPFYAKLNASYPTPGRITEVMNTLATMGARTIRSQTLGVSVGNPLSVMPALGVYNERAFDTIDWAVFQARQHGLRIMAPLVDNYVSAQSYLRTFSLTVSAGLLPWRQVRLPSLPRSQRVQRQQLRRSCRSYAVLYQRHNCTGLQELHSTSHYTRQPIHWSLICRGPYNLRLRDRQRTRRHPLWGYVGA